MYEIRLHGLGGEGVVRLSEIIGKVATKCGKWAHSFPFFGTEVRGAAVKAFTRVDDKPINIKSYIYEPDVVIVTNDILLGNEDVLGGLKEDSLFIINTNKAKEEIQKVLNCKVIAINATSIAYEIIGKPIVNTIMLGALLGATDLFPLAEVNQILAEEFGERLAAVNIKAMQRGYEQLKEVI